jgi:hypothetical protein
MGSRLKTPLACARLSPELTETTRKRETNINSVCLTGGMLGVTEGPLGATMPSLSHLLTASDARAGWAGRATLTRPRSRCPGPGVPLLYHFPEGLGFKWTGRGWERVMEQKGVKPGPGYVPPDWNEAPALLIPPPSNCISAGFQESM